MKLITRDTDYAVRAICYIAAKRGGLVSTIELVKELRIPRPFLRKILQILNRKDLLKSYKGRSGGFVLARPPDKIFLSHLVRIFQDSLRLNECIFIKRVCPNIRTCKLKKRIDGIEEYVISKLKTITMASLLK